MTDTGISRLYHFISTQGNWQEDMNYRKIDGVNQQECRYYLKEYENEWAFYIHKKLLNFIFHVL